MGKSNSLVLYAISVLALGLVSACNITEDQADDDDSPGSDVSVERITRIWVSSTVESHVLQEMFDRDEDGTVMSNIRDYDEERREIGQSEGIPPSGGLDILVRSGVISGSESEYQVALDIDEWHVGGDSGVSETEVRQAMLYALEANDVDWCGGDPIDGYDFAVDYVDSYWELYDTREEYVASIEEYVECGPGE